MPIRIKYIENSVTSVTSVTFKNSKASEKVKTSIKIFLR